MVEDTGLDNSDNRRIIRPVIHYEEPPIRKPPITETGVIGWLRTNLFGSPGDTILTIFSIMVVISATSGFLKWSISQADWDVVTRNLRLFMSGRYPVEYVNRIRLMVLIIAVMSGFSWRVFARASKWVAIGTVVLIVGFLIIPVFTNQLPYPSTHQYIEAVPESQPVGTVFLLQEADSLSLSLSPADPRQGILVGFSDTDSATRAGQAQRIALGYDRQLARAVADPNEEMPAPLPDPDISVVVRILNGETLEEMGSITAAVNSERQAASTTIEIPSSGWYIVQSESAGQYGAYWLTMDGARVLLSVPGDQEKLSEEYGPIPEVEGARIKLGDSAFLSFRGERTFSEYLLLQVGPFFEVIGIPVLIIVLFVALGYVLGMVVANQPWTHRLLSFAWAVSFVVVIWLLRGMTSNEYVGLAFIILSLTLIGPAINGAVGGSFAVRDDSAWVFRFGMAALIGAGIVSFIIGWSVLLAITIFDGMIIVWYTQQTAGQHVYRRWMVVTLGTAAIYFFVAHLIRGAQEGFSLAFTPEEYWDDLVWAVALGVPAILSAVKPASNVRNNGETIVRSGALLVLGASLLFPLVVWDIPLMGAALIGSYVVWYSLIPVRRRVYISQIIAGLLIVAFYYALAWFVPRARADFIPIDRWGDLILALAFVFPVLHATVRAYKTRAYLQKDRSRFLVSGVVLTLGAALVAVANGRSISLGIIALTGVVAVWYALAPSGQHTLLRQIAVGLVVTIVYYSASEIFANLGITTEISFISTERWGGIILTMSLALVSISASFPIGVLLALGRRSELPVIRLFCIGMIEFVRGVPLITILFMASIMVPLLSPSLAGVDAVVRAMVGFTLFSAAYVAEIVRGGLQAVPHGQTEAAKAVGMSGWQITYYIILPQALRAVIPALVGQFISLFKDTSLVFIVGLIELLGVAQTVVNQGEFIGRQRETLIFIGIIYFVGSYAMSSTSRRLEESGVGAAAIRRL